MGKRKFEFARKVVNGEKLEEKAFPEAQIPVYMTKNSAGCDFLPHLEEQDLSLDLNCGYIILKPHQAAYLP